MDKFVICGGRKLEGEIPTSGAKNSALPCLAAALLTEEPVRLHRIPQVRDIATMNNLLRSIGAEVDTDGETVILKAEQLSNPEAPYELVKTMRASSLVLGPLVARAKPGPGVHAGWMRDRDAADQPAHGRTRATGRVVTQSHGYIEAAAPDGLRGAVVHFDRITVTGTEDLMMAATLAKGETVLRNAAREPEVKDLAELLIRMGAQIEGAGTSTIRIAGVERLHGAEHTIIPDRIEAGTFLIAGAITGGDLLVTDCQPDHLMALRARLGESGIEITQEGADRLRVRRPDGLKSADMTTEEHPGFATDLQAQYMALMTQAEGIAMIVETIFENRFMHALELARMGANIRLEGRQAIVAGARAYGGAGDRVGSARERVAGVGRAGGTW